MDVHLVPTDYAPRQKRPPPGGIGKQVLALRAFGVGAVCGVVLTLALVYLPTLFSNDENPPDDAIDEVAVAVAPSLTYEFMDRLPNEEVVTNVTPYEPPVEEVAEGAPSTTVEDEAPPKPVEPLAEAPSPELQLDAAPSKPKPPLLASAPSSAPPTPAAKETPPPEYLLRTQSFQSKDEADALRARLILAGLAVAVKVVEVPEESSHRVVVGPFPNQVAMRETRSALRAGGIAALSPEGAGVGG